MEKNGGGGVGENTDGLEKKAKMLEKINTIIMSLRKVTSLGSNFASVTDLKRIQTPYSLCYDF